MTVKKIILNSAAHADKVSDLSDIFVSIQDNNKKSFFGNPVELYFGSLQDVPARLFKLCVIEISQICSSSDPDREGANILLCQ